MKENVKNNIHDLLMNKLDEVKGKVREMDVHILEKLLSMIENLESVSDHFFWCVDWEVTTFDSKEFEKLGKNAKPKSVLCFGENITLDSGVEVLWKLVTGSTDSSSIPFSNGNARLIVGSSSVAENSSQTGVQTKLASAGMNAGFPQINGRSVTFEGNFGDGVGNGAWEEVCIANGETSTSVSLNRRVKKMLTKEDGSTVTLKVVVSAVTSVSQ